jgi:hypothetical protein
MEIFTREPTWYAAGLAFECAQCGRCCAGPQEGYVWVSQGQIRAIHEFLGLTESRMMEQYVRRVGARDSLRERPGNNDCVFLADGPAGCRCAIYPVRPTQCRTWPFWSRNLASPQAWSYTAMRCPGINHGKLFAFNQIETHRHATSE